MLIHAATKSMIVVIIKAVLWDGKTHMYSSLLQNSKHKNIDCCVGLTSKMYKLVGRLDLVSNTVLSSQIALHGNSLYSFPTFAWKL